MKVKIFLDPKLCIAAGKEVFGVIDYEIDLFSLSKEEREYCGGHYSVAGKYINLSSSFISPYPKITEISIDSIKLVIAAGMNVEKAEMERKSKQRKIDIEKALKVASDPQSWIERSIVHNDGFTVYNYRLLDRLNSLNVLSKEDIELVLMNSFVKIAREKALSLIEEMTESENKRVEDIMRSKKEEEEIALLCNKALRENQELVDTKLVEWVSNNCSKEDIERHSRGFMPKDEIIDLIKAQAFKPIDDMGYTEYVPLTADDLKYEFDADELDGLESCSLTRTEFKVDKLTSKQFCSLIALEKIMPETKVEVIEYCTYFEEHSKENDPELRSLAFRVHMEVCGIMLMKDYVVCEQ